MINFFDSLEPWDKILILIKVDHLLWEMGALFSENLGLRECFCFLAVVRVPKKIVINFKDKLVSFSSINGVVSETLFCNISKICISSVGVGDLIKIDHERLLKILEKQALFYLQG